MKNKILMQILSLLLVSVLVLAIAPVSVFAFIGELLGDHVFNVQVGVAMTPYNIVTDYADYMPVVISSGSLPNGITFTHHGGSLDPERDYWFEGTALPGTVGTHSFSVNDNDTTGNSVNTSFEVSKGLQTIVLDDVASGGTLS